MKIAIIGSGIAGLTAAWALQRAGHQVTIYERGPQLGMSSQAVEIDTHTIEHNTIKHNTLEPNRIEPNELGTETSRDRQPPRPGSTPTQGDEVGQWHPVVDVPPRMFNDALWPRLSWLYHQIGVASTPVTDSKSYSRAGQASYLQLATGYWPRAGSLLRPELGPIAAAAWRLYQQIPRDLQVGHLHDGLGLREYLEQQRYSPDFVWRFLYPSLSSTVCTCDYTALNEYPAALLLTSLHKMVAGQPLRRSLEGTRDVVRRLTANLTDIRLNESVRHVRRISPTERGDADDNSHGSSEAPQVECEVETANGRQRFDHVIFATQANHVVALLPEATAEELQVLRAFRYQEAVVVVHHDPELLPPRPREWAVFNLISDAADRQAMCTVWMNRFQTRLPDKPLWLQTIMPHRQPHPAATVSERPLQRVVVNRDTLPAWAQLQQLHRQPDRRLWFCGSYACYGIPLLESGVESAFQIVDHLGVSAAEFQ